MKRTGLILGFLLILMGLLIFKSGTVYGRPTPPETGYFIAILGAVAVVWNWPSDKIEEIKEKIKKVLRYR